MKAFKTYYSLHIDVTKRTPTGEEWKEETMRRYCFEMFAEDAYERAVSFAEACYTILTGFVQMFDLRKEK